VTSESWHDRGVATLRSETRNQAGEPVQVFPMTLVVPRPPRRPRWVKGKPTAKIVGYRNTQNVRDHVRPYRRTLRDLLTSA
jgi:hypothetical protein